MKKTNHIQSSMKSTQSQFEDTDFYEENLNNFSEISELSGYIPQLQQWSDGDDE
jgi:hypothetical protein